MLACQRTDQNMLEKDTRQQKIDQLLRMRGWNVGDLVEERKVDLSGVRAIHDGDVASGFVDYVLHDRAGIPLAVIEAKRTARYALSGKEQAAEYADSIAREYGRDPFIFLTNGEDIWFWDRAWAGPRPIAGFFTRDDLETRRFQHEHRRSLASIEIDWAIAGRDYQAEAIRRVYEALEQKRRKFLLVLATGTGKTRLAMALVDGLMRANWIKRVLFLVDRRALAEQALDAFKTHLPSITRARIEGGEFDTAARAFIATYPSMMQLLDRPAEKRPSPGFFDLIICDESHRSIYNRYKRILDEFDAYQLGLTATPVELVDRNTFELFETDARRPTFSFPFEDAINAQPAYICNFQVYAAQTRFQLRGIKAGDLPPEMQRQLEAQGISLEEIDFEGTDLERRVTNAGTDEALVREFMDISIKDPTGTLPGKSIIFAISHRHALNLYTAFERLYPEYRGRLVEVIDSQMEGAERVLKRFKAENFPRVAISVDMLDTGIDVREIVNLVFAKPVYSRVKFWQMIGRGTRLLDESDRKPWCTEKDHFLIIDHWDNFGYFEMQPEGRTASTREALPVRRFRVLVDILEHLKGVCAEHQASVLADELRAQLGSLPRGAAEIRDAHAEIQRTLDLAFWSAPGPVEFTHLRAKIAPLLRFLSDIDEASVSFALKTERLALAWLRDDAEEFESQGEAIRADLRLLPVSIGAVAAHQRELREALSAPTWVALDYDRIIALRDRFMPLMRFRRSQGRALIELDVEDQVLDRRWIEFGPAGEGAFVETYREQVETRIKELAQSHPTIRKIAVGDPVADADLHDLAQTLNQADLFITEQNLRTTYGVPGAMLVDFVRHTLDLARFESPAVRIGAAFDEFLAAQPGYSADKILFIRTIRTVLVRAAERAGVPLLTRTDLFAPPFTRFGRNAAARLFTPDQLDELLGFVKKVAA